MSQNFHTLKYLIIKPLIVEIIKTSEPIIPELNKNADKIKEPI